MTNRQKQLKAKLKHKKQEQKLRTRFNKVKNTKEFQDKALNYRSQKDFLSKYNQRVSDKINYLENSGFWDKYNKVQAHNELLKAKHELRSKLYAIGGDGFTFKEYKEMVNYKFNALTAVSESLRKDYVKALEYVNGYMDLQKIKSLVSYISGLTNVQFFFIYNKVSTNWSISDIYERFNSDFKILTSGDTESEEYAEAKRRATDLATDLTSEWHNTITPETVEVFKEYEEAINGLNKLADDLDAYN